MRKPTEEELNIFKQTDRVKQVLANLPCVIDESDYGSSMSLGSFRSSLAAQARKDGYKITVKRLNESGEFLVATVDE